MGPGPTEALGTVLMIGTVVPSGAVRLLYPTRCRGGGELAATDPGTRRPPGGTP
ncbi:hypothetical protein SAMN05660350_03700 [Geodermatophilus obscurus]|uniref:Uncharacterized protein n=1 Tax=Geodermatophilus obscurus TaxID=1861 RepID=A0A1M7UQ40_9ACTN|nr:hypothetical protein [Geodermatophilus obscurus]SHN85069.1 hypothetical protein SAMN05660350_03700 [Geodermatophilus obscurus]